jgi:hypothetical protein
LLTQPLEQAFGLQLRTAFQHLFDLGPILSKGIGAGPVAAPLVTLAGQVAQLFVFGHRFSTFKVRFDRRLLLRPAFSSFLHH